MRRPRDILAANMPDHLIEFWRECHCDAAPFAHPRDVEILRARGRGFAADNPTDFESYIAGQRFDPTDDRLHLSLLPVPYAGDLKNAPIVLLLLNPGFEYSDYWAEYRSAEFRKALTKNLHQHLEDTQFPFLYLDPQFCWHTGFIWWEKKLRDVIRVIARERHGGRYLPALQDLARNLACIELVPYHSVSFADHRLLDHLPSVQAARTFVRETLIPEARSGKRTVIVTRQVKGWGLTAGVENLVIYEGGHTRGASLSTRSAGGQAILRRYGITAN